MHAHPAIGARSYFVVSILCAAPRDELQVPLLSGRRCSYHSEGKAKSSPSTSRPGGGPHPRVRSARDALADLSAKLPCNGGGVLKAVCSGSARVKHRRQLSTQRKHLRARPNINTPPTGAQEQLNLGIERCMFENTKKHLLLQTWPKLEREKKHGRRNRATRLPGPPPDKITLPSDSRTTPDGRPEITGVRKPEESR